MPRLRQGQDCPSASGLALTFKEYKHPICLTKHRWEHTPYWKEPTQLSMSKHQQVQALEVSYTLDLMMAS